MGRTAPFDRLARVARIARVSERLDIPSSEGVELAEEFDRARVDHELTRRTFLKGAAALTAGAVIGLSGAWPRALAKPPTTGTRIAVVGSGLAGLACAYELKQENIIANVFEASDRAGGRCYSLGGSFTGPVQFPGQVVERGGEFIDTLHTTMRGYAREFGLELEDVSKQPGDVFYHVGGTLVPESTVVDEYRALVPAMNEDLRRLSNQPNAASHTEADRILDFTNLEEYLTTRGAGPIIHDVVRAAYTTEYGLDIDRQSCLNFLFYIHADRRSKFTPFGIFSDERFHVVTGNQGIPAGLAAGIGGQIEFGHRLVRAAKNALNEVLLTFDTGAGAVTRVFDIAVFAIPFSVLRTVELDASLGLPPAKRYAIDNLAYGTNAKLMVGFDGRPWRNHGSNGSAYATLPNLQTTWETNPANATNSRAVLTDYTGGALGASLGKGQVDKHAGRFLADLDQVYPGASAAASRDAKKKLRTHLEHWPSNPLALGSYTCNQPGYFTTIADNEGTPVDNLYFAGEHTSSFYEWQGFMEGAALSGVGVASAIRAEVKA